jgi:bifunctional DNA-binding transcriptional regulator/antitoxin component of YhaV-PrlF toxin-antitoxin module
MTHSTITSKGGTTLPATIRRNLHLKEDDRISYGIQGDTVVIRPQSGAMAAFGSSKPPGQMAGTSLKNAGKKLDWLKLRRRASVEADSARY